MTPESLRFATARAQDYAAAEALYKDVIAFVSGTENDPIWTWGVHPCERELRAAIDAGGMLLAWLPAGGEGERLAAAIIVNNSFAEGYNAVSWQLPAQPHEIAVLHLFAVHPDFTGRGIARAMLSFVQENARERGFRVIRFDVIGNNTPAMRMYERCGFSNCGPAQLFYPEDPLACDFVMFEKGL